jgi:hypothetical protein
MHVCVQNKLKKSTNLDGYIKRCYRAPCGSVCETWRRVVLVIPYCRPAIKILFSLPFQKKLAQNNFYLSNIFKKYNLKASCED